MTNRLEDRRELLVFFREHAVTGKPMQAGGVTVML
jgi:hypothetical protein